jgi:PHD/YefM family antitoxin component YafN of YafNO toxin-antitoxin module
MAEQLRSISDARKSLREISETAQARMNRYIITNQGQPQSVLLGYKEYQGLKATVELLSRPQEVSRLQTGLEQLDRGERLAFDRMKQNLHQRRALQSAAAAVAGVSSAYAAQPGPKVAPILAVRETAVIGGIPDEATWVRGASAEEDLQADYKSPVRAAKAHSAPAVRKANA